MVTMSFYWIPSELIQGGGFLFIYLALIDKIINTQSHRALFHFLAFASLVTVVFGHPLLIFGVVFGLLYYKLYQKKKIKFLSIQLFLSLSIYLFKNKVLPNPYDNTAMGGLGNLKKFFIEFDMTMFGDFFSLLMRDYIFLSTGALALFIHFFRSRQILKLLLFSGFFIGYSFIVNVAQIGAKPQFYIESQYLILSIFVILPMVSEVLFEFKGRWSMTLLISITILSLFRIQKAHSMFTERLNWYRGFLEKTSTCENQKIISVKDDLPMNIILEHWGSAYEFWLLSTIETGETRSILFTNSDKEMTTVLKKKRKKMFITKWTDIPYRWLNPKYFILNDTLSHYEKNCLSQNYLSIKK